MPLSAFQHSSTAADQTFSAISNTTLMCLAVRFGGCSARSACQCCWLGSGMHCVSCGFTYFCFCIACQYSAAGLDHHLPPPACLSSCVLSKCQLVCVDATCTRAASRLVNRLSELSNCGCRRVASSLMNKAVSGVRAAVVTASRSLWVTLNPKPKATER